MHRPLFLPAGLLGAVFLATPARAELVAPDSIARPTLANVGSADGTPVPPADLVTSQYGGKGLLFQNYNSIGSAASAITQLNGVNVWTPVISLPGNTTPVVSPMGGLALHLVQPGTTTSANASAVTVEFVGVGNWGLYAWDAHGNYVGGDLTPGPVGPHGGELLTVTAPGITWLQVFDQDYQVQPGALDASALAASAGAGPSPWGVAEISFTPAAASEPNCLLLACLGTLGCVGWRPVRRALG